MGFWERAKYSDYDALVCTTNNVIKNNGSLVMGAGIAKAFRDTFRYVDMNFGKIVEGVAEGGYTDYGVVIDGPRNYNHNAIYLVGFQTKRDWKDPSDIDLIINSAKKLVKLADSLSWTRIICPKFGCANGQLVWKDVEKSIKNILDDRFLIIDFSSDGV